MARFLFTMLPVNDLGLPTRMLPIARALADRGHEVAVFNPAPAPMNLIAEAGLTGLGMPSAPTQPPGWDIATANTAWDVDEMFAGLYANEAFLREMTAIHLQLLREYAPDVVVDSFNLTACLAARILKIPLVTVNQGNFHPASAGFKWWEKERPAGLPSGVSGLNKVAAEHGAGPFGRCVELMAGDLSLIVGTPETDPVADVTVRHVGPIVWQRGNAELPEWVDTLGREKPLVWVYAGNPQYDGAGNARNPFDSIVVIRAAIAALKDAPVNVVLTMGHQELPEEIGTLPGNFHRAAYLPGMAMAERCDLMVHHGGHSSVMTGLKAGTPAVMIPTATERESNARRMAALGAGEIVMPVPSENGEKDIDLAEFGAAINRVLSDPAYRKSAQRVAETMRQYGGTREAADRIEQFARSQVTVAPPG